MIVRMAQLAASLGNGQYIFRCPAALFGKIKEWAGKVFRQLPRLFLPRLKALTILCWNPTNHFLVTCSFLVRIFADHKISRHFFVEGFLSRIGKQ